MSAAVAYARPQQRTVANEQPRHIEIVPTRAQRAARPTSVYAVTAVCTIFGLLLAQLVLSILLSDGAFQIAELQSQQKTLSRTQEDLSEKLDLLGSPQNLATKAEGLGMVLGSGTPVFLNLADGTTRGSAKPVSAGAHGPLESRGSLVPNALLDDLDESENFTSVSHSTGAPAGTSASASVTSTPGMLPSPTTR
jgi:hypothetical protein